MFFKGFPRVFLGVLRFSYSGFLVVLPRVFLGVLRFS